MFGYGPSFNYIPEPVSNEVFESEARVAAEIAALKARFGDNYTLFRHPDSGELTPLEGLGMSIDEWRNARVTRESGRG